MATNRNAPPGHVNVLSAEERWKQFRPDGGFAGESGGAQDEKTEAVSGKSKKKGVEGAKVAAPNVGAPMDVSVGMSPVVGGASAEAPANTVLPGGQDGIAPGADVMQQATDVASSLPVTTREATVAASADLKAEATPLSKSIDTLSDHLASGTTDMETLAQDISNFKTAMQDAGLGDEAAAGLKVMMDSAQLSPAKEAAITKLALNHDIDVAAVPKMDLADAKQKLVKDLSNDKVDAGVIDLDVEQVKNLLREEGGTQSISEVLDEAVNAAPSADGHSLGALYAAAAKNGVDLSQNTDEKVGAAKNNKALATSKRQMAAEGKKVAEAQAEAQAQAAHQQQQQQQAKANGGGGGGGGGSTGSTIKAPTYDPAAVASPHGAKENLKNWTQQVYPKGQFNQEQQHYTDGNQNISFNADGSTVITAKNEGNGDWSSARITGDPVGSLPKYLEATMLSPSGKGTWDAFWLVGTGSWPQGGEIDVMEHVNGDNSIHASNHWGTETPQPGDMPNGPGAYNTQSSIEDIDMSVPHRYGVNVTEDGVQFYLDGKPYGDKQVYPPESNFAKIASEMVPTINLAMGGTWPEDPPLDLPDQQLTILSMTRSDTPPDQKK